MFMGVLGNLYPVARTAYSLSFLHMRSFHARLRQNVKFILFVCTGLYPVESQGISD